MSSVLAHIRGSISLPDTPFIPPDNALHVYSLAQQYGARHEAARAARITIQFPLTIGNLEDKLDVMTGRYLYGLWKYHRAAQLHLALDLNVFRESGVLQGLDCISVTSGIPSWLDRYIEAIIHTIFLRHNCLPEGHGVSCQDRRF
jgi:hypothetical protein